MNVTVKEMSTREVLERLESCVRERLNMSAQEFIALYQEGKIDCPGTYADMLALVRLLPSESEEQGFF